MRATSFLLLTAALASVLAAAFAPRAEAQSAGQTGSLYGVVRDPSGAPVPGVAIFLRHAETGFLRRAGTDEEGRYRLSGLPVGSYRMRAEHAGFEAVELADVEISVGASLEKNLELTLSGPGTRVEVSEQQEAVEAASTAASAALGGERIEETPARSRNSLNFVALAPGLTSSPQGGVQRSMTVIRQPAADSGFSFPGLRGRNNSMEVDGLDNRDKTTGGNRVAIGLEMVQEFRVAGAITEAELGGAAGELINVVTRTGSCPISARPAGVGRNPFFMRGAGQLDARLMKTVFVKDGRARLQFGAESFNLINRATPATVSEYGMAAGSRLFTYGRLAESMPARQVQFFMQFDY